MTNVEALTEIALGFLPPGDEYDRRNRAHAIALHLAKSGCLQVDSLTDEQAVEIRGPGRPHHAAIDTIANSVRTALRRCATGEAE